jgi:hypothetical protein
MSSPVFSVNLPYKTRCQLPECRKPVNLVFRKTIEGNPLTFCSTAHANLGEERWLEKLEKNVRMDVPVKEDENQMTGDNIADLEGGEI